jgi:hypothetical protein
MVKPEYYEIHIEGDISSRWSNWFAGLDIKEGSNNETILTGELQDQAALHGVLMKIRDLHLVLISVNRLPQPQSNIGA